MVDQASRDEPGRGVRLVVYPAIPTEARDQVLVNKVLDDDGLGLVLLAQLGTHIRVGPLQVLDDEDGVRHGVGPMLNDWQLQTHDVRLLADQQGVSYGDASEASWSHASFDQELQACRETWPLGAFCGAPNFFVYGRSTKRSQAATLAS